MGICVSEKSACGSRDENLSHVIKALYKNSSTKINDDTGSIRITLGQHTTKRDIDILIKACEKILNKYRQYKSF
jgi:cysteine sulfinate desulfinase/cysteine desulfurase-like protein